MLLLADCLTRAADSERRRQGWMVFSTLSTGHRLSWTESEKPQHQMFDFLSAFLPYFSSLLPQQAIVPIYS